LFKSGWSALGAALVLLGACVSTLSPSTRRRLVVLVPVVLTLGVSPLGGSLRWGAHGHAVVGLIPWMMAFGVAIAILALGRERIDHAPNPGSQLN
jgi:hypothetical protein